jgi:hypothetical protein
MFGFINSIMSAENNTSVLFQIAPNNSTLSPEIAHIPYIKRLISMG